MRTSTILLKARDFAMAMTAFNVKVKMLCSEKEIFDEHIVNIKTVQETLVSRGIIRKKVIL